MTSAKKATKKENCRTRKKVISLREPVSLPGKISRRKET